MKKKQGSSRRGVLLLSASFLSGIALLAAAQGAADQFLCHPAFIVREVEVQWPKETPMTEAAPSLLPRECRVAGATRPDRFRLNPPTSTFRVDLKGLATGFQRRFPTVEVEEIRRVLPNRLVAVMRPRKIVGQLQVNGLYASVSDDGILVSPGFSSPQPGLPVLNLSGLKGPLRVGRSIDSPGFWKASELLATLHRDGGIAGHRVAVLRVDGDSLLLGLDSGAEIRFPGNQLAGAWQQLTGVLGRRPELLSQSSYIDLRYGDPVIGDNPKKNEKRAARRRS